MTVKRRRNGFQVYVCKGTRRWRKTVPTQEQARALEAEWRSTLLQGNEPMTTEYDGSTKPENVTLNELYHRTYALYWANTKGAATAR